LIMFVLYGLQLANAIKLEAAPHDVGRISDQGVLAIAFFLFGIARAWQLVGAREFSLVSTVTAMIHRPGGEGLHLADGHQPGPPGGPGGALVGRDQGLRATPPHRAAGLAASLSLIGRHFDACTIPGSTSSSPSKNLATLERSRKVTFSAIILLRLAAILAIA